MYFDGENKKRPPAERPPPPLMQKAPFAFAPFCFSTIFLRFDYINISIIANRPFNCPLFALQSHKLSLGWEMKSAHTRFQSLPGFEGFLLICMVRLQIYCALFNHYCLCRSCSLIAKHTQLFPLSSDADNPVFFSHSLNSARAFSLSLFLRS
jgi:hypothetical protein